MTSATHTGHCQLCDHVQKLPGGRLAKHGYAVRWSQFVGVCPGSRNLPYELSCDMIAPRLAAAQAELERLTAWAQDLCQPATEAKGWHHEYRRSQKYGTKGSYRWVEVPTLVIPTGDRYAGSIGFEINGVIHAAYVSGYYGHSQTPLELAGEMNARRAGALDGEMNMLRGYMAWLTERQATWRLQDLTPVPADAK